MSAEEKAAKKAAKKAAEEAIDARNISDANNIIKWLGAVANADNISAAYSATAVTIMSQQSQKLAKNLDKSGAIVLISGELGASFIAIGIMIYLYKKHSHDARISFPSTWLHTVLASCVLSIAGGIIVLINVITNIDNESNGKGAAQDLTLGWIGTILICLAKLIHPVGSVFASESSCRSLTKHERAVLADRKKEAEDKAKQNGFGSSFSFSFFGNSESSESKGLTKDSPSSVSRVPRTYNDRIPSTAHSANRDSTLSL